MFMGWSMFVTWGSFEHAAYMTDMLTKREMAAWTEGKYGGAATFIDSLKFFVLLMIQAFSLWVSAYSIGGNVDELVDFFNHYDDDTSKDADTKKDSDPYVTGSATQWDLFYHAITTFYTWVLYSFIMFGGYYFSWYFAKFHPVSENCDT